MINGAEELNSRCMGMYPLLFTLLRKNMHTKVEFTEITLLSVFKTRKSVQWYRNK